MHFCVQLYVIIAVIPTAYLSLAKKIADHKFEQQF